MRLRLVAPMLAMATGPAPRAGSDDSNGLAGRSTPMRQRPEGPGARLMSAGALVGDRVLNRRGELLGTVSELMLDVERGCIAYVVMAYGGFMGLGERLFALPWNAIALDAERGCMLLDAERSTFDTAPAFDKDHWPSKPDAKWHLDVHRHYGSLPYWHQ